MNELVPLKKGYGGVSLASKAGKYGPDLAEKLARVPGWAIPIEPDPVKLAAWFSDVRVTQDAYRNAVLDFRHPVHAEWVRSNYGHLVGKAMAKFMPETIGVRYISTPTTTQEAI